MGVIGSLVVAALGTSAFGASAVGAPAIVTLTLDSRTFLEGERIYYTVDVRNASDQALYNLGSLLPGNGDLTLILLDEESGKRLVPNWMPGTSIPASAGPTLLPWQTVSDARNLNWFFGERDGNPQSLCSRLHQKCLRPGRYRLRVRFRLHSRFEAESRGTRDEVVDSRWARFEIRPVAWSPSDASLVAEFLADPRWQADDFNTREQICEDWLPRFKGSRLLATVFAGMGSRREGLQAVELYRWMGEHKIGARERLRLIQMFVLANQDKWLISREWLEGVRKLATSRAESLVVERAAGPPRSRPGR